MSKLILAALAAAGVALVALTTRRTFAPRDSKVVGGLHPQLQPEVERVLSKARAAGLKVRLLQTSRSDETHADNIKRGVTRAKVSHHQSGRALDYWVALPDGRFVFPQADDPPELEELVVEQQRRVADLFKAEGWTWGGDWRSFRDTYHVEKPVPGFTAADGRKAYGEQGPDWGVA